MKLILKITLQKQFVAVLILCTTFSFAQVSVCSWNIMNLGKSKSNSELEVMANSIKAFDIVAIQEVVAGPGGAQAVSKLVAFLNTKGTKWDYSISQSTTSNIPSSKEKYAFLWKASKVKKIGNCWLDQNFQKEIDREPFMGTFQHKEKVFTLVSFHAVPKKKNPESEIKYFKFFPKLYPKLNLIFLGDFNCPQSHTVFNPLKNKCFAPVLKHQKTSIRHKCIHKDCLASEYDNLFYDTRKLQIIDKGIVSFYTNFNSMKEARKISDHVPIWCTIEFK